VMRARMPDWSDALVAVYGFVLVALVAGYRGLLPDTWGGDAHDRRPRDRGARRRPSHRDDATAVVFVGLLVMFAGWVAASNLWTLSRTETMHTSSAARVRRRNDVPVALLHRRRGSIAALTGGVLAASSWRALRLLTRSFPVTSRRSTRHRSATGFRRRLPTGTASDLRGRRCVHGAGVCDARDERLARAARPRAARPRRDDVPHVQPRCVVLRRGRSVGGDRGRSAATPVDAESIPLAVCPAWCFAIRHSPAS